MVSILQTVASVLSGEIPAVHDHPDSGRYTLADLFLEYRLLRHVVMEILVEQGGLGRERREALADAFEMAMETAGVQFSIEQQSSERLRGDQAEAAFARERRITEILQRPLLLRVAEDAYDGLRLATLYEPLRSEAQIGGDFLDVFALRDGQLALVVGDACGKGLEAAVHNTYTRDVLRAILREVPGHPAAVLQRLNRAICDTLRLDQKEPGELFITLSLAVLDAHRHTVHLAAAGMELPQIHRASGRHHSSPTSGSMALGIDADETYDEQSVALQQDDRILLVSDGITEARDSSGNLFDEHLPALMRDTRGVAQVYHVATRIMEEARAFSSGMLKDDATVVVARVG
ncbi:MAG: PP2C family protein-serine/threonine phosphatase [Candidatus Xenobia bacterium]